MVGIVGGLLMTAGTAAADRTAVVVIDATGSMTLARNDCDNNPSNRFETAKCRAVDRIATLASQTDGLSEVHVFTFTNNFFTGEMGLLDVSGGFVTAGQAITDIEALTMPSGTTPLAGSLCDAIDAASASGSGSTTTRFVQIYTDGEENDTDPMHPCAGPDSVSSNPFDPGSWQNNVWNHALDALPGVTIEAELYNNVTMALLSTTPITDAEFFSILTADTGGKFTHLLDGELVPVFGDIDGDRDVDRDDAIQLALSFGAETPSPFDLDDDGKVGYSDYEIVLSLFGTGDNAPEADPYTPGQPVKCGNRDQEVVIDGEVIEDANITIDVRGECTVVIRNSLIVSGRSAVRVRGRGTLVVDNSIIAGEGAWLTSSGRTILSAAGSIFHGAQNVKGAFEYEDRGGNAFQLGNDDHASDPPAQTLSGDDDLGGGCSVGSGASGSSLLFALFAVLFVIRRRRD